MLQIFMPILDFPYIISNDRIIYYIATLQSSLIEQKGQRGRGDKYEETAFYTLFHTQTVRISHLKADCTPNSLLPIPPLSHSTPKLELKNSIHKSAHIRTNQLVKICDDLWT